MQVTFREQGTTPDESTQVFCDGITVGSIRRSQDGHHYEYYHGPQNVTAYAYQSSSLEQIKRILSDRMGRSFLLTVAQTARA